VVEVVVAPRPVLLMAVVAEAVVVAELLLDPYYLLQM
jgi:hypothetical protein